MKISVIIPTYQPKDYLWECLNSLTSQTISKDDYEVIIVLNGCDEPYKSQIQSYIDAKEGFHFSLIQTDVPGVSNARNIGLDKSKGEYISFIDDDDYVSFSYLEELYQKVAPDVISVCFPHAFNDGVPNVQLQYSLTDEFLKRSVEDKVSYLKVKKLFSGPCMKMINKDIVGDRRFDCRLKNGEDSLFMFSISDKMR